MLPPLPTQQQQLKRPQLQQFLPPSPHSHTFPALPGPCRYEEALLEDGTAVDRPVIRLDQPPVMLTRIDPAKKETSMILRPRPGWEELRSYLAGEQDAPAPDGRPKLRCGCGHGRGGGQHTPSLLTD